MTWHPVTREEARTVPCPHCHAPAGQPCRGVTIPGEMTTCHGNGRRGPVDMWIEHIEGGE